MSVILPKHYKVLAEELAKSYVEIRDAIYRGESGDVYSIIHETLVDSEYGIAEGSLSSDVTLDGSDPDPEATSVSAPPGSIGSDLGSFWFSFANSNFSEERAKSYAASLVGEALRRLNSHIVSRMNNVNSVASYYSSYAYGSGGDGDLDHLDLFYDGSGGWDYFTTDFAELSSRIGVTISEDYVEPDLP